MMAFLTRCLDRRGKRLWLAARRHIKSTVLPTVPVSPSSVQQCVYIHICQGSEKGYRLMRSALTEK